MPAPFRFDRRWVFRQAPDDLWAVLSRTDDYPRWWSWLRRFEARGLTEGSLARCEIRAPLPYVLRLDLYLEQVDPGRLVQTQVRGDLTGDARLEVLPHEQGSEARLTWDLELRDPVLRRLALVARPAMVWAHDRVVELGLVQFRRHALDPA